MNEQRKDQDKRLNSGERQVAISLDKIEPTHIDRYKRAYTIVKNTDTVLDLGCGCGYGSVLLANKARKVIAIDDSKEAIDYANVYWKRKNINYLCGDVFDIKEKYDVVVAFEIVEHIKDTDKLFDKFKEWTKEYLIFSVPHISIPVKRSKWHWEHFSEKEIRNYVKKIGLELVSLEKVPDRLNGFNLICLVRVPKEMKHGIICPCGKMISNDDWKRRGIYKTTTYDEYGEVGYQYCFHGKVTVDKRIKK